MLGTIQVELDHGNPWNNSLRALCDTGSQINLITYDSVKRLRLRIDRDRIQLMGIQNTNLNQPIGSVQLIIKIPSSNELFIAKFYVVKNVSCPLPQDKISMTKYDQFSNLELADPGYGIPGVIDALFGINIWIRILKTGVVKSPDGLAAAQQTALGWVIYQREIDEIPRPIGCVFHAVKSVKDEKLIDLSNLLQQFWEVENVITTQVLSIEERECERYFVETHTRTTDGRYVVHLPFKESIKQLGKSKSIALKQFYAMERKMQRNDYFKAAYTEFMQEYEQLGHLTKINETHEEGYYTPHHGVNTSGKFRVVANASCKTTSGPSLNECQLVGPKLQNDLANILMRFRSFEIAVTADIVKMFRQVEVHDDHKKYQKFLWRYNPEEPVGVYQLNRVAYGQAAAPYLAVRAMQQCALDYKDIYPIGAEAVLNCFYVDDALAGADSIEQAKQLKFEMTALLNKGCFELAKWCSNEPELEENDIKSFLEINDYETKSILGLRWLPQFDEFGFLLEIIKPKPYWTKREILSQIGRLYDPNGYISPITVTAKILIQKLWLEKIDWDDRVPNSILNNWLMFLTNLTSLNKITIPRWLGMKIGWQSELHCFCDASEDAYAATVYVKSISTNGDIIIRLVQSKTKVAPLKKLTIPRLELCGAHLGSKLAETILKQFIDRIRTCYFWTDSSVVLSWLHKQPNQLKTFVSNRVAAIQHKTIEKKYKWRWVAGENNPADLASRGVTPDQLTDNKLWWNGPEWLALPESEWPQQLFEFTDYTEEISAEVKLVNQLILKKPLLKGNWFRYPNNKHKPVPLLDAYSNIGKLKRVMAFVLRAVNNMRSREDRKIGQLSTDELKHAMTHLIRIDQSHTYSKELNSYDVTEKTRNGSIWLDQTNKVLRLCGRVQSENLTFDEQYPIILSPKGSIAKLIIKEAHNKSLHGGIQQTLQLTRQRYWIYQARRLTKTIISRCINCMRYNLKTQTQLMATLPINRTKPQRPFKSCAVDYLGPVGLASKTGRNPKITKAYVCVFVCTVTRAIHLELVNDASTTEFIAAFRSFISTRGAVASICSDNGTNFVGANNWLQNIYKGGQVEKEFNLKWSFITPNAPHHGGLHEAAVKSTKKHLRRVIGQQNLTFREYHTLLKQVEASVNSRPICPISDDPNDLVALTPGHFLIGEPLVMLTEENDLTNVKVGRLTRWQMVQQMNQNFWARWHDEYIMHLAERTKWKNVQRNLQVNDLVIIREDNLPPSRWSIGRIIETFPAMDGFVRTVKVRTKFGEYLRPITKLGLIMQDDEKLAEQLNELTKARN